MFTFRGIQSAKLFAYFQQQKKNVIFKQIFDGSKDFF